MPRKRIDLKEGQRFGRLTVVGPFGSPVQWLCICDCRKACLRKANDLVTLRHKTCGCGVAEATSKRMFKHGYSTSGTRAPEYGIWSSMKHRCHNDKNSNYPGYGGRGISVCKRWRDSFSDFISDVGPRPSPSHSLERIDNNGNYEPGNCKWATRTEQALNRRNTVMINGVPMAVAAEAAGLKYGTVYYRHQHGWPADRLLEPLAA